MLSVIALNGVTSFLHVNILLNSPTIGWISSVELEEADNFKCVFVIYCLFE